MSEQLLNAIEAVKGDTISFSKHISASDAGKTKGHQGGIYIPKLSAKLMFEKQVKKELIWIS